MLRIVKVYTALLESFRTFGRIPIEIASLREKLLKVFFRHSEAPHKLGCDTFVSFRGFAMTETKSYCAAPSLEALLRPYLDIDRIYKRISFLSNCVGGFSPVNN